MKKTMFSMALVLSLTFGFIIASCDNNLTGTNPTAPSLATKTLGKNVNIHFNVKNGGAGLVKSKGEIITKDGVYFDTGGNNFASNFTISLGIPAGDQYVIIHWWGTDMWGRDTHLSAKLSVSYDEGDYDILIDYNGRGKATTEGLDDVQVW